MQKTILLLVILGPTACSPASGDSTGTDSATTTTGTAETGQTTAPTTGGISSTDGTGTGTGSGTGSEAGTSTTATEVTTAMSTTGPQPVCGDGPPDMLAGETCDHPECLASVRDEATFNKCIADNAKCYVPCEWANEGVFCSPFDGICKDAECGDGQVNFSGDGPEVCDLGKDGEVNLNDGSYGGCAIGCKDLGPYCGDAIKNGLEECDGDDGASPGKPCTPDCKWNICGDAHVLNGEECDDGDKDNGSDGCTGECKNEYVIFVTKATYPGNIGFISGNDPPCSGLDCAHKVCRDTASDNELTGTYKAWLSTSSFNAYTAIPAQKYWMLRDGVPVGNTVVLFNADPKNVTLKNAISLTEDGATTATGFVWTGTNYEGKWASSDCGGWIVGDDTESGTVGSVVATDSQWTMKKPTPTELCSTKNHLYCFRAE